MNAALDGSVSFSVTVLAVDGPSLRTVATYVTVPLAGTLVGVALLSKPTSANAVTWLVTLALLLLRTGSPMSAELTGAVLVRVPVRATRGRTTTVTVAVAPTTRVPILQFSVWPAPFVATEGVQVP